MNNHIKKLLILTLFCFPLYINSQIYLGLSESMLKQVLLDVECKVEYIQNYRVLYTENSDVRTQYIIVNNLVEKQMVIPKTYSYASKYFDQFLLSDYIKLDNDYYYKSFNNHKDITAMIMKDPKSGIPYLTYSLESK